MLQSLRGRGIFVRLFTLVIFEILLFAVITPFLWIYGSEWSFAAAGTAAGSCLAPAILSLCTVHVFRDPKFALTGLLLGTTINMFIPLAVGIVIQLRGGPLSLNGFLYYLVFFYLLTLAVKTVLILPLRGQDNG
jgi:hypothetical protein